jgi:hypothetical protein
VAVQGPTFDGGLSRSLKTEHRLVLPEDGCTYRPSFGDGPPDLVEEETEAPPTGRCICNHRSTQQLPALTKKGDSGRRWTASPGVAVIAQGAEKHGFELSAHKTQAVNAFPIRIPGPLPLHSHLVVLANQVGV